MIPTFDPNVRNSTVKIFLKQSRGDYSDSGFGGRVTRIFYFYILVIYVYVCIHAYLTNIFSILLRFYHFKNVKNMSSQIANKIQINSCLVLNQYHYCSHNSGCHLQLINIKNNILLQLLLLFTLPWCTITIVHLIFIAEMFEPQLFSFHATCLHTRLTEFLLNHVSLQKTDHSY